jgi:LuxR family maltose regulon positive regulatory protein
VLDDYHLISDPGIHTILAHLVQYASAKLHLVVLTRHDPPWRVARLRAQHQVIEIRAADLHMTPQEAMKLLEIRLAQRPSTELVAELHARTEGWIAGLQLSAAATKGFDSPAALVDDLRRHDSVYVMDYLFDEVLEHQSDEVRDFLLKTALLVRFNVQLAAEITKRGTASCRRTVHQLRQENLFIVALDNQNLWYRYHHQFHDLLADRARATFSADVIMAIRRDAAQWLASHGYVDEALAEYMADKHWDEAANLVEAERQRLHNGEQWNRLWQQISRLPDDVVAHRPALILSQAWILQVNDHMAAIPPLVEQAEALLSTTPLAGIASRELLQGEVLALRGSWIYPKTPVEQRISYLEQALPLFPASEAPWLRGFVYINLADLLVGEGQTDLAYRRVNQEIEATGPGQELYQTRLHHALGAIAVRDGMASDMLQIGLRLRYLATKAAMKHSLGWANFGVGWAHYERRELSQAAEALLHVFDQPYSVHLETMILALTALVPVAAELGRGDEASALVEQTSRIALERANIAAVEELAALSAYAALLRHDTQAALTWAERYAQSGFRAIGGQRRDPHVSARVPAFARIALAQGSKTLLKEAIDLLEPYTSLYRARGLKGSTAHGAVLLACCYWRTGQTDQALRAMQLAVDIAWPRGLRAAFYEPGTEIASLLYAMIQRGISAEAASALLAELRAWRTLAPKAVTRDEDRYAGLAIVPLSERESEILALLAAHLSNKEIARRLGISPITVRNHTSSIYTKLNVTSRKQAVTQARILGLVPQSSPP